MADNNNDMNHAILNLSPDEKRAFAFLFNQADSDQLGVVTGERAVSFFERTHVNPNVLGEIWQIADTENRGLLTKPGFCMVLRLIGHYQAGREPSSELAFRPGPIPKFDGLQIPGVGAPTSPKVGSPISAQFPANALQPQLSGQSGPIRVPPLDPQKVQQYSGLFERSGAQNGLLDGVTAKSIFERAGLPNEILGRIWSLSDLQQRGALDQTEFIIAMHLLTSFKARVMTAIPATLPAGLYEAAARRGAPPQTAARQPQAAVARQFSGQAGAAQVRTQSPLARTPALGVPPVQSPMSTGGLPWLVSAQEKAKYDQFFATVDTGNRGVLTGEQAVQFFSNSGLPEDTLAQIWDLADIQSEGQLNRDEFAVAMYLIRQQRSPNPSPLPAFLPPALIPPSMRTQNMPKQTTGTAFGAIPDAPTPKKSAADDLFGLDAPASPPSTLQQPALQAQTTGLSASRDPFEIPPTASSPTPLRTQTQSAAGNTTFKPFMPTSAFGASLAQQNTGGSTAPGYGQSRLATQPSTLQQAGGLDDLLGDDETNKVENSKLTNETTELANMSNQIGNLRTQMEQTQSKKASTQQELSTTMDQKKDLELRLQQFRAQYEQEVRTVKELEKQLAASKDSTKKLSQEIALLDGTYRDLQTQRATLSQQLQADQQENASLKQQIAQVNGEVATLKPAIEKLKLDARQQKGLVSINKKQLATNEGEKARLQEQKNTLEQEAIERERNLQASPSNEQDSSVVGGGINNAVTSPTGSTMSSTNPFFRGATPEAFSERTTSPAPNPSAFDAIFGPSSAFAPSGTVSSRNGSPPATSFIGRSIDPVSSAQGASAPAHGFSDVESAGADAFSGSHAIATPPPQPEHLAFTPSQLPLGGLKSPDETDASSTAAVPPASRAGPVDGPQESTLSNVTTPAASSALPGAFPTENESTSATQNADFDSAFASFDEEKNDRSVPPERSAFASSSAQMTGAPPKTTQSEFPPITNLEPDDEDSDDSDDDFEHTIAPTAEASTATNRTAEQPPVPPPAADAQSSPPSYEHEIATRSDSNQFPAEFTGLLPSREDPLSSSANAEAATPQAQPTSQGSADGTVVDGSINEQRDTSMSGALSDVTQPHASVQAGGFDEFDEFDDLAEAKEADKGTADSDFGFGRRSVDEFNPAFDSPAASMTTTAMSQSTPTMSKTFPSHANGNAFDDFQPTASHAGTNGASTTTDTQHDWDAIFSGLDSSKPADTSAKASDDPWSTASAAQTASTAASAPSAFKTVGRALTPGTEHDDPILKRLTNLGYPRSDALSALEMFDYDINKAADHLSGT